MMTAQYALAALSIPAPRMAKLFLPSFVDRVRAIRIVIELTNNFLKGIGGSIMNPVFGPFPRPRLSGSVASYSPY
ncbi:hypothetical protein QN277_003164 [Acacia crassicarpa]|uniref:Uncharacterized protein n=1 Tax=Acacia crassicarpa TaxID=499986 RepID=A0AAE1IXW1_9FABA|nr:hypothetical protein QN277_003164 [Acacia crassicarpa]